MALIHIQLETGASSKLKPREKLSIAGFSDLITVQGGVVSLLLRIRVIPNKLNGISNEWRIQRVCVCVNLSDTVTSVSPGKSLRKHVSVHYASKGSDRTGENVSRHVTLTEKLINPL